MKTLKETKCGETVKVLKLTGDGPVKRRIMDMGITKGASLFVRKVAPFGDPVEIGYMMLFLLSQGSTYLTGQDFAVDGGALSHGF